MKNKSAANTSKQKTHVELNAERMREIEKKAEELKVKHNAFKVYPIVFNDPSTHLIEAVGYLKEPSLQAKLAVMDIAGQGQTFSSAAQILEVCLIREESDPRLISIEPQNHMYYLGAVNEASKLVKMFTNQFKKKSETV